VFVIVKRKHIRSLRGASFEVEHPDSGRRVTATLSDMFEANGLSIDASRAAEAWAPQTA
jgi:hypothetical protein